MTYYIPGGGWSILIIGGCDGTNYLSQVEYIHMSPEGITVQPGPSFPHNIEYASVAVNTEGSTVYVIGGDVDSIITVDVQKELWSPLPNLQTRRRYGTAFFMNNHVYTVGGFDMNGNRLSTMECLNINSIESGWIDCGADLPEGRVYHASCVASGYAYISGGRIPLGQSSEATNTVIRWKPGDTQWYSVANTNHAHYTHAMSAVETSEGSWIYVTGGYNNDKTEVYDPNTGIWTDLMPLPFQRDYVSSVYMPTTGEIVVPGGRGPIQGQPAGLARDTIYLYDINDNNWTESNVTLIKKRYGHSVVKIPKPL